MSIEKEEEMKNKLKSEKSDAEIKITMATQRINELREKIAKAEKEVKEFQKKDAENRATITTLKEEIAMLKARNDKLQEDIKEERRQKSQKMLELDKLKEEKEKSQKDLEHDFRSTRLKELTEKLEKLQKEYDTLKLEREAQFFDENGYLKEGDGLGFADQETLYRVINKYLVNRPSLNLYKEFQALDKSQSGTLTEAKIYEALGAVGIKLKTRDQALLLKDIRKTLTNEIKYKDLYLRIKGVKDVVGDKASETITPPTKSPLIKDNKNMTENEKNLQRNIDILKNEITNLKKENEKLEKQLNNWKENYSKLDKEHKALLGKPFTKALEDVDAGNKTTNLQKLETVQELRDRIFELENKIAMLEKHIAVEKEPLIKKLKQDKEKLENEIKQLKVILDAFLLISLD